MALGYSHPKYLKRDLSPKEIMDWQVYDSLYGFGEHALFKMGAIICSVLVNLQRKKGKKAVEPQEFLPVLYQFKKKQEVQDMKNLLRTIAVPSKKRENNVN